MNPKVQIEKLKKDWDWLMNQALAMKTTFNAALAVSKVFESTDALSSFGDYFAYSQNIMIENVQLQLAKIYDKNKQSNSLPKLIELSINLYTEEYYEKNSLSLLKPYSELKKELDELQKKLSELEKPIKNLKTLRDKNLAHLDKSIGDINRLEEISYDNPLLLSEGIELIEFSISSLVKIKEILFGIGFTYKNKDYVYELTEIAKAIEEYL